MVRATCADRWSRHESDLLRLMEVHRETLYEEVWETPLSRLAPEKYGISDVGLRKVCEKLHVPTPPRGYWAKRQHGKDPPKEPLPDLPEDATEAHTFDSTETSTSKDSGSQEDDAEDSHVEASPIEIPEITVDPHLKNPHPLIRNARNALKDAQPDTYGRVQASTGKAVSVSVSPSETGRALRILDALVKGAESVGWPVRGASAAKHDASHFVIADEEVPFRITERTSREEKPESERSLLDRKYRYSPTGQFRLEFPFNHPKPRGQKKWRDTETRDLEDVLPSILERAHEAACGVKERREEQRQFQRKLQEKIEKRKERRRRRKEEKRRREKLEEEAERWSKARSLREYIREVRSRAEREELAPQKRKEVEEWLEWAEAHADRVDPLSDGLPTLE